MRRVVRRVLQILGFVTVLLAFFGQRKGDREYVAQARLVALALCAGSACQTIALRRLA